ncbi:MAG TPA: hypothetical protein EYM48_01545 [Campylobacterales bacterium]|nr:MAG: hypothetical protein SPLUMA1_SPLUMAMAG1_00903 [uncultured Sulfurimonas sp.]CAI6159278.1 MAG: hypothetical protein SPLUMA2_SPLUMAMAG2_00821 [uncultured Sulfurimonas sp.]HIM74870.1 hypothetical protein [Campylobacterales bacterium]
MYTVQMQTECSCFKKSEYTNNNTFKTQQEAYQYANIVAEFMNEEFCSRHTFYTERADNDTFVIRVDINATDVSGCSTGVTCDVGCGSTDDWTMEAADNESCGSGCGCA